MPTSSITTCSRAPLVREPGKYKIAGKPFGSKEPYGIGLPLDSDGVAFVNDFLKKIEDDGTDRAVADLHRRPYGRHQRSRAARDRRLGSELVTAATKPYGNARFALLR